MKKTALILFMAAGCLISNAQIVDMLDSELFNTRVKLVSEFMQRFNGEEKHPYIDSGAADVEKMNLCQLFDAEYIRNNRQNAETKAFRFVDSVLINNVKIHFGDPEWYAKVKAVGQFKGKEVSFDIYLTVEPRGKDMYKWVISDVDGEIFNLKPSRESDRIMLLPNEHEANFMHLNSITSEKDDYITLYSSDLSPVDRLTVFNTLVYYGYLDIDYVTDIEYTFLQVPGYSFTIKEFERESTNSGWLISDWTEITKQGKQEVLQRLYNGKYATTQPKEVKSGSPRESVRTPAGKAIQMVESFVRNLNTYIKDKSTADNLNKAVKGRYKFIISDNLSNQLAKYYKSKSQKSYRLDTLLGWLGNADCPIQSIMLSDAEPFENENIRPDYASGYTLVKCDLSTTGLIQLTEKVVFFIYQDQIAGIKYISECF